MTEPKLLLATVSKPSIGLNTATVIVQTIKAYDANDPAILEWKRKADALDKAEQELTKMVEAHRKKEVLTCLEDCWCWGVEAVLLTIESHEEEPK